MRSVWEIAEAGKDIGGNSGLRLKLARKRPGKQPEDSARVAASPLG